MKREIKFRGKRTDNKGWVYGSLEVWGKRDMVILCPKDKKQNLYDVDPTTVGQYTGLKDKSGIEIYEGDLIQVISQFGEKCVTEVWYCEDGFVIEIEETELTSLHHAIELCDATVIGNIHDNQEPRQAIKQ